jgi:hypothetical protein
MPHEYQVFFPAAICLHAETGINVVMDAILPIPQQNLYLTFWLSHPWKDIPPPFRYLSELLKDPSRAAEFLVTEKHFTNLALLCAKFASGETPHVVFSFLIYDYSNNPIQPPRNNECRGRL